MTGNVLVSHEVIKALQWRYATKKFDSTQKIPSPLWQTLEETLRLTPTSFGLQPYRFVVVTDPNVKQQLVPVAWNQQQVVDCSHLVIFARLKDMNVGYIDHYLEEIAKTRKVAVESLQPFREMMTGYLERTEPEDLANWMSAQCYIALGNLMTAASLLQIDNCPMEGFQNEGVDRILQLPERGCQSVVMCALGYRAADDKYQRLAKVRFPANELFIKI